jgi:membrane associated rhomboid family serine protease
VQPAFRKALFPVAAFVLLLWLVVALGLGLHLPLIQLGIYPRTAAGLAGILFAPLIHGSWSHLISNSFALLVLGTALRYGYPRAAGPVMILVYLLSGLGVWCLGRESYHIGASGLTHGMMFFIFTTGILRRDRLSIALSLIAFFLYGGMVWSIFPQAPDISFESHFFGAASGVLAAFLFRRLDPPPPEKHYDWEDATAHDVEMQPDNDPVKESCDRGES